MGRSPCCDKATVKRGPWSEEEDARLRSYIEQHGGAAGSWMALPRKAGLRRCGKSCRLRWLNYLRPGVRHGGFSPEEDRLICALYAAVGSRWSLIAAHLPGRTDNGVKNYWNSRLKKKLAMLLFAGKAPPHAAAAGRNVNASAPPAAAVLPPPPPLEPWTGLPYPYTGCSVDQTMSVGAGGGGADDMIAAAVVSQLPADARYSSEPAATELDEIFRSSIGNTTGGEHSDVCHSSSTGVEMSWYHQCQQAGESLLHQQHTVGAPYDLYW